MPAVSAYTFGDVVLVPFPFSNQTGIKKRPAVIVSSRDYNTSREDVLILAITSQAHTTHDYATFCINDWKPAGLLKPSYAKPVLTTLEQSLVIRSMGHLSTTDQRALRQMLVQILG